MLSDHLALPVAASNCWCSAVRGGSAGHHSAPSWVHVSGTITITLLHAALCFLDPFLALITLCDAQSVMVQSCFIFTLCSFYCPTVWNQRLPPQHINTTFTPDSSFQTSISVVSSDNALRLLPSLPFHVLYCYTHACSAHLLLCACFHTHHLFLYASYYMPVSCLQ